MAVLALVEWSQTELARRVRLERRLVDELNRQSRGLRLEAALVGHELRVLLDAVEARRALREQPPPIDS